MKISNIIITSILLITLLFSTSSFAQPDYSQEVNSSDILEQIENGEDVYISNSLIKGKLDLSSISLSKTEESGLKIVRSQITIENSLFEEVVDFSNTLFENKIEFDSCNLHRADFSKSHFKQDVNFRYSGLYDCNFSEVFFHKKADFRETDSFESNFENSIFNGQTRFDDSTLVWTKFYHVTFTNKSFFQYVTFRGSGDFRKSTFSNPTIFQNVYFDSVYADFIDSTFNGLTSFRSAKFGSDADFTNTTFNGPTEFISAKFGSDADFTNTTFDGSTEFISADFDGLYADFTNTAFLDEVDFSKAVFTGDARFNNATFKKNADFKRVEFNNVIFIETEFEDVSFTNADFSKMYVDWYNIKDSLTFDGQFYLKLRENFVKLEEYEVSDDVYYNYRKNIRKDKDPIIWFLDLAISFICGYGVKPQNTIFTGFIVVLGFARYYYYKEHGMSRKPYEKPTFRDISTCLISATQRIIAFCFLSLVRIIRFFHRSDRLSSLISNLSKKNDNFNTKGFCNDCYDAFWFSIGVFTGSDYESSYSKNRYQKAVMLEKIIGSLIFTLFVVTLTNVLIRI